jgi:hypothetical protein
VDGSKVGTSEDNWLLTFELPVSDADDISVPDAPFRGLRYQCKWQQLQLKENDGNFDPDPVQTNDKPNVPKDQTVLSHHVLCSCCFPMPAESAKVPD